MATKQQSTSSTRQAGHPQIVFRDEDGIFWLRGDNLARAKKVLDLSPEQGPLGFDCVTIKVVIDQLLEQGISVGISCGSKVWTITKKEPCKPGKVESKTMWLSPSLVFGQKELADINRHLNGNRFVVDGFMQRMRTEIADGDAIKELGRVYVYQVADLYEIDWELTTIPEATIKALALAAYETGSLLCCQLVPPKSQRINGHRQTRRPASILTSQFVVSEPTAYGQLRFEI